MSVVRILRGDDTDANGRSVSLFVPEGDYGGIELEASLLGHRKTFSDIPTDGSAMTWNFTADETRTMPLGVHRMTLALTRYGKRYTLSSTVKVCVCDDVAEVYGGDANTVSTSIDLTAGLPDISGVSVDAATPNALATEFRKLVNILRGTVSAVALLLCLPLFSAGVSVQTSPLGDVAFTNAVVTGVSLDVSDLTQADAGLSNRIDAVAANVAKKQDALPYATNAIPLAAVDGASAAIQAKQDSLPYATNAIPYGVIFGLDGLFAWKQDILPYATNAIPVGAISGIGTLLDGKQDSLPYETNSIPFSAITGVSVGEIVDGDNKITAGRVFRYRDGHHGIANWSVSADGYSGTATWNEGMGFWYCLLGGTYHVGIRWDGDGEFTLITTGGNNSFLYLGEDGGDVVNDGTVEYTLVANSGSLVETLVATTNDIGTVARQVVGDSMPAVSNYAVSVVNRVKELHADTATNIVWQSVYSNGWHILRAYTNQTGVVEARR